MKKNQSAIAAAHQNPIRVVLAEDNTSFRKSLKLMIEGEGDIEVVGEAKNGRQAVQLVQKLRPEVVVTDISMPIMNGLEAARQIVKQFSSTRVLVLSAHSEPEYIKQSVQSGASGYLIKQSLPQVLSQAIREVAKGNSFFCAPISKPLRDRCRKAFGKGELEKKRVALQAV
jgi:DNA-binding NarL/FixJ family response regulator